MSRIISIRHRRKQTAKGEARPTQVVISKADWRGGLINYSLDTEQEELDFLLGIFPRDWRKVDEKDIPSEILLRHRKPVKDSPMEFRIPMDFDGLAPNDTVLVTLGGSGDRFNYALSRQGEGIGATVYGLPAFELKNRRAGGEKEDDAETLARVWRESPSSFYKVGPADRSLIELRERYIARQDAQRARIGCSNRLRQRFIGGIFLSKDGMYPEGLIEDAYDEVEANDEILHGAADANGRRRGGLVGEETRRTAELTKLVESLPVYREILGDIKGMGPVIAAGIIVAIGDIRRFSNAEKLKKFCGVHVMPDGRFPRRRTGELANWHPNARQALYQFGDQMSRQKDSKWGLEMRKYKVRLREKHPEPVIGENNKKKYTDAHIHKMATWRAITRFTEWLYGEWTRLERRRQAESDKADAA